MRQWRLIYDTPTNGAVNMAVDAAILHAVSEGRVLPTLRLYGWNPPCLSLGYGQRVSDVDLERLVARGWEIVRRPTGGKAILHTDELTYSVALPIQHPLAVGGVIESYREISKALVVALRHLGVDPSAERKIETEAMSAVCFETPSHYEITVNGKKLVGSAQVRRKDGVLQHGTLPLYGDITRICDVLRYEGGEAREAVNRIVRERATTLESAQQEMDLSGSFATASEEMWKLAADAVVRGFQDAFGIEFEAGSLTDNEYEHAARLREEMFGNESWIMKR